MHVYITIGGSGTRLKGISPKDKHLLYYKNHRIIDWIKNILPDARVIGENKTKSRKETLSLIPYNDNILIIDCDIIPFNFSVDIIDTNQDCVVAFTTNKKKYGSILLDSDNMITGFDESNSISDTKCSGIYFIKNLQNTLNKMIDSNSIVSGMIGSKVIFENTFMRFGDIEDYLNSIKQL